MEKQPIGNNKMKILIAQERKINMCKCIRSSEPFVWHSVSIPVTLEVKTDGWRNKTYYIDHGLINYGVIDNLEEAEKIYFEVVEAKKLKNQTESKQCKICKGFTGSNTLNAANICNRCYADPRKIDAYIRNIEEVLAAFRADGQVETGEKSQSGIIL